MPAQPRATVDFVADVTCPWCTIGRRRLDAAIAALAGDGILLDWAWRPFMLHPDAPRGGYDQATHLLRRFGSMAAADRYHDGVVEAGRAVGFDFRYDRILATPNTMDAHRLLVHAGNTGRQAALAERLASAFFTDGVDIGSQDALVELARMSGMDGAETRAMLDGEGYRAEVVASDAAAKRAGIRLVPTFCFHGRILDVRDIEDLSGALRTAHRVLARSQDQS